MRDIEPFASCAFTSRYGGLGGWMPLRVGIHAGVISNIFLERLFSALQIDTDPASATARGDNPMKLVDLFNQVLDAFIDRAFGREIDVLGFRSCESV